MSRRNRGAALVIVLWSLVVIGAVVAADFARGLLLAQAEREAREEALGCALAQAGVSRFLQLFLADLDEMDKEGESWLQAVDSMPPLEEGAVEIQVKDCGSCLNLNLADQTELALLFPDDRATIDAILDWLDGDDEKRPAGAERDDYAALDPPILPANGFFRCPEEVLLVRGLAEQGDTLASETTVFGPANPNFITQENFRRLLLEAGSSDWEAELLAEQFIEYRKTAGAGDKVPFSRVDDLTKIPGLSGATEVYERLRPCLIAAGTVNPNLAGEAGLRAALARLKLNRPEALQKLLAARENSPFKDLDEVYNLLKGLSPQLKRDWVAQVFTCQTRIAGVEAASRTKAGTAYRISAVIERYHPDGESGRWRARILYWREQFLPNLNP